MMNSKFARVLAAICLGGIMVLSSASAQAQEEGGGDTVIPQSTLVVDDGGQGDTTDAGTNNGPWIALGENTWAGDVDNTGLRLEGGWPLMDISEGRLSIVLPFVYAPDGNSTFRVHNINIVPGARFEWPVLDKWGQLVIWGDFGFGVSIFKADGFDSTTYGAMRFASGATFIFPFNLLLTVQPVGVMALMGHDNGGASYEFSFMVGYRF